MPAAAWGGMVGGEAAALRAGEGNGGDGPASLTPTGVAVAWRLHMGSCVDAAPVCVVFSSSSRAASSQLQGQASPAPPPGGPLPPSLCLACSHDGVVACVDAVTGCPLWQTRLPPHAGRGLPALPGGSFVLLPVAAICFLLLPANTGASCHCHPLLPAAVTICILPAARYCHIPPPHLWPATATAAATEAPAPVPVPVPVPVPLPVF